MSAEKWADIYATRQAINELVDKAAIMARNGQADTYQQLLELNIEAENEAWRRWGVDFIRQHIAELFEKYRGDAEKVKTDEKFEQCRKIGDILQINDRLNKAYIKTKSAWTNKQ